MRNAALLALSLGGVAFALLLVFVAMTSGWWWPGPDAYVWDRVGDAVRAGSSPYGYDHLEGGFYYAPPWALALALVTWLPVPVVNLGILVAEVLALRYVVGSWRRVGYACWLPLVPLEFVGAQWNLVMTAAIAAAVRGEPRPAVMMAFAKIGPAFAIDARQWRPALVTAAVLVAVTLPWASWWVEWANVLRNAWGANIAPGAQIEVPYLPRLAAAILLAVVVRRPWARVLAAILAVPALYPVSALMLLALVPLRRGVARELHEDEVRADGAGSRVRRVVRPIGRVRLDEQ